MLKYWKFWERQKTSKLAWLWKRVKNNFRFSIIFSYTAHKTWGRTKTESRILIRIGIKTMPMYNSAHNDTSFRQYLHPAASGKCAEAQQPGLKNLSHGRKRLVGLANTAGLANAVPPSPQNLVGLLKSTKTHNSDSLRQCCGSGSSGSTCFFWPPESGSTGSTCFWASWIRIH